MELQAVKTDRLYIKVAEQLSKLVKDGAIKPGERFPAERDLAERLGVSRPTIREAMIALELSGVIEIRTGSGIYVSKKKTKVETQIDSGDKGVGPFEILEIRYILEAEACALAAARITDEQIAQLKEALKEMEEEEKRERARLRKTMVPKANPIRHYKPVCVEVARKMPTVPESPAFASKTRAQIKAQKEKMAALVEQYEEDLENQFNTSSDTYVV